MFHSVACRRARSRIGYHLKSLITWNKNSTPEPVRSRVTRQVEYVLHLSVGRSPLFSKSAWQKLPKRLGGVNPRYESKQKVTDSWNLATATGQNGHGAEFPMALPGRCIALSTKRGDLVLDPFVGGGTTALAAAELGRRCVGFDISSKYVERAKERVRILRESVAVDPPSESSVDESNGSASIKGKRYSVARPRKAQVSASRSKRYLRHEATHLGARLG